VSAFPSHFFPPFDALFFACFICVKLTSRLRPDWSLGMHGAIPPLPVFRNIRPTGLQTFFSLPFSSASGLTLQDNTPLPSFIQSQLHLSLPDLYKASKTARKTILMMATVMLAETFVDRHHSSKAEVTHRIHNQH
jgi:hypothetical protein